MMAEVVFPAPPFEEAKEMTGIVVPFYTARTVTMTVSMASGKPWYAKACLLCGRVDMARLAYDGLR
jgi:hypothetical protein